MRQNPFIVGQPVPPEHFIGRTSLIATAFDQIHNRSHLAVWGGRGLGKSSFLYQLTLPEIWQLYGQDRLEAVIVSLSCKSFPFFSDAGFWQKVLELIQNKLDSIPNLQADIDRLLAKEKNTVDDLRRVLHRLGQQNKYLVLLVDDYDVALCPNHKYTEADIESFVSECRSIACSADERKYLSMIVTSSRMLNELGPKLTPEKSPWFNHYLFRQLKPFTDSEVDALFTDMPINSALKDKIRELAGENPFLLQNAGYILYEKLRAGNVLDSNTFAGIIEEFQRTTQPFFQAAWERSTEIEQNLLMLLAISKLKGRLGQKRYDLSDIENIFSQNQRELKTLVDRGVIKQTGEQDEISYAFASSVMEWWVVQEISKSDETEIQQREKSFFNLMNHQQIEKFKTVNSWLWQHKDQISSFLKLLQWLAN